MPKIKDAKKGSMTPIQGAVLTSTESRDNIKVDNIEVTAIVISRLEKQIKDARDALNAERVSLEKQINDDRVCIIDIFRKDLNERYEDVIRMAKRMTFLSSELRNNGACTYTNEDLGNKVVQVEVSGSFHIQSNGCDVVRGTCELSAKVLELFNNDKVHSDRISEIRRQLGELTRKMIELPSVERRFRAELAERYLASMDNGAETLARVDEFVKQISSEYKQLS
jgi:hypothetical protein